MISRGNQSTNSFAAGSAEAIALRKRPAVSVPESCATALDTRIGERSQCARVLLYRPGLVSLREQDIPQQHLLLRAPRRREVNAYNR